MDKTVIIGVAGKGKALEFEELSKMAIFLIEKDGYQKLIRIKNVKEEDRAGLAEFIFSYEKRGYKITEGSDIFAEIGKEEERLKELTKNSDTAITELSEVNYDLNEDESLKKSFRLYSKKNNKKQFKEMLKGNKMSQNVNKLR